MNYIAIFTPQAWLNDYAITVDAEGETSWDCTAAIAAMPAEYQERVIATGHDREDRLKADAAAPEWVREWKGPFEIHVREAAAETEAEALRREARQEAMLDAGPILAEHRRAQGE